jgi:hypothetical protein
MNLTRILATFAAAVLAAVVGWFGGGVMRDALAPPYESAIAVVNAEVGVPVATASPSPSATASTTPTPSASETPEPEKTEGSVICEGAPPGEGCDCDLQDGEWVWVCEIPATSSVGPASPSATP